MGSALTVSKVINTSTVPIKGKIKFSLYNFDYNFSIVVIDLCSCNFISLFFHSGAFVPLTMEGNILVDGVLASCYSSAPHDVAQIVMTPLRWFPGMMDWIFGVEDTFPVYVKICEHMGKAIVPLEFMHA